MDKFDLIKVIGEGAFGKAYLAREKSESKHCVIKEVNFTKVKEASSTHICHQMMPFLPENSRLFIVMEYCDGGDLMKRIQGQQGKLFGEGQILGWFVQISVGLKYLHDRKILHRDIKAQNIFLSKNGMIAKLGDFGIARVLNNSMELARTCVGTPYYLSPEICQNRPYNNKTDIWSLGCVLYELCTLRHPFEGNNLHQLVLKICQAHFAPISPRFSHDLRSLIPQLFKVSPRDRPSINSILKRPFLESLIAKYLTPKVSHSRRIQLHAHKQSKTISLTTWWEGGPGSAEYVQRKFEAQQYKLKVEKQLGLRPSSAEPHRNGREELRSHGEAPRSQELQFRKNKTKDQEYWKQLAEIRQQYYNDMKEIKKKIGRELERGVKFEISLENCVSEEDTLQKKEAMDTLNDTLSFEDGMKVNEPRCMKECENYTDKAFEELCGPEADFSIQNAKAAENRRQWEARAPQTLLQMMAAADVTSTCPTVPDDGQVAVMERAPQNRKQWRHEPPATLMTAWAAAHLSSSSFSASEGERVGIVQQWLPKDEESETDYNSEDEELDPGSDGDDTNFEESEDELRNKVVESLEKLATPKEQGEEASSSPKDVEKSGEKSKPPL
uniref:non-specific serine/threonine protein kinase n=1 Tax=Jaculus jaculus TaxID=51337 RepID=A0A8C5K8V1_JACJA